MDQNPYSTPAARVEAPALRIPEDMQTDIRRAAGAALFCGIMTVILGLLAWSGTLKAASITPWDVADGLLILGLAYGIYRRSRVCAVSMLVYYIGGRILVVMATGKIQALPMAAVFVYFFANGVKSTFAYHRLLRKGAADA